MNIQWAQSPNYWTGRNGRSPIAIVNHITAGLMPGCLSWMRNASAKASAHYLVTRAGLIYQMVKDENSSFHAGAVNKPNWKMYDGTNPNRYTIGIEHEGMGAQGGDGALTDAQYQATLWLHKQLIQKWKIPVDTDHIIGHYRIDSVNRPNCPGPNFPWAKLFKDLTTKTVPIILPDGKQFSGQILNLGDGDHTYIQVREILEALSFKVIWDAVNQRVIIER